MDIKLSMLILLIGAILAMAHLTRGNLARMKRDIGRQLGARAASRRREP
jgi:hypothetical protein